jgi:hypothetical protein
VKIGYEHLYRSYHELLLHSENVTWGRFQNLLIINSVLVVAWATLFQEKDAHLFAKIVMTCIAALGVLTGIAWADLGRRGRQYLESYKAKLKAIEEHHDKKDWWVEGTTITDRPYQIDVPTSRFSSSRTLLVWTPLLFAGVSVVLLIATWVS